MWINDCFPIKPFKSAILITACADQEDQGVRIPPPPGKIQTNYIHIGKIPLISPANIIKVNYLSQHPPPPPWQLKFICIASTFQDQYQLQEYIYYLEIKDKKRLIDERTVKSIKRHKNPEHIVHNIYIYSYLNIYVPFHF